MNRYEVIGLMSGTSLDGVDMAHCTFFRHPDKWEFSINKAVTVKYPKSWQKKLNTAITLKGAQLNALHMEYGTYTGELCLDFMRKNHLYVDFIASHGHTIFHQPDKKLTLQIGDGKSIASVCGVPVIFDFRSLDVRLGGQGAPLVPVGDMLLFGGYDCCINLGGFANISYSEKQKRIAFDICPLNIVLNEVSRRAGKEYDKNGEMAGRGFANMPLLNKLNMPEYYRAPAPKSLGKEWVEQVFAPLFKDAELSVEDLLRTLTEHFAFQIHRAIPSKSKAKILLSGGGAHNTFLVERIKSFSRHNIIVPSAEIIDFKEALIFAFLGVLRYRNETNCLASVTGATQDCCGGIIAQP